MLNSEGIQVLLKQKGVSQRELVQRSGLSESVVSILIKQMPVLLPHLVEVLGENPYANQPLPQGEKMAEALHHLSSMAPERSIPDPADWQDETRRERVLPGRG